jgi:hypothetical protein
VASGERVVGDKPTSHRTEAMSQGGKPPHLARRGESARVVAACCLLELA